MPRASRFVFLTAASVFAKVPHTFSSGSPAKAEDVNQNFKSLDSAIGTKADQAALSVLQTAVNAKADQTALKDLLTSDSLKPIRTSLGQMATTSQLDKKADTSDLNSLRRKQSSDSALLANANKPVGNLTSIAGAQIKGSGVDPDQLAFFESGSSGGSGTNQPWDWAVYQSLASYNSGSIQLAGRHCSGCGSRYALRTKDDNSASSKWSPWYELWHRGNLDPANYLTLSGGTISGSLRIRDGLGIELSQVFPSKNYASIIFLGYSGETGAANWGIRGPYQWANGIGNGTDGGDLDLIKSIDRNIAIGTGTDGSALGNVGIGTIRPSARLEVNGDAKVSGTISGSNIAAGTARLTDLNIAGTITTRPTIPVADYVFEPDYKPASLQEIEAYTKEHKHLPEIPSAAEIEKGGLDLTQMNLLLLKKVEELTLHAIAQQKALDAQTKINDGLRQEMQLIMDRLDRAPLP